MRGHANIVQMTKSAEVEIERTYEWLKERNPSYSDRWFRELMDKLATLQAKPRRCALAIGFIVAPFYRII